METKKQKLARAIKLQKHYLEALWSAMQKDDTAEIAAIKRELLPLEKWIESTK